jgi:hypothetical protein
MNILRKAILRLCWQEEQYDRHAPRPWLRWLLTRVVGMEVIRPRKSERVRLDNERWLAARKEAALRIDPETAQVFWEHGQVLDPYWDARLYPGGVRSSWAQLLRPLPRD